MIVFQLWDPSNEERSVDVFVQEPFAMSELQEEAILKYFDGVPIPVASIRHLIEMKSQAARPIDLDDIAHLRQIAHETGQSLP